MKIRQNRTFSMKVLYLLKYILNKCFHLQMTKLSICYYYDDDGKIHSVYINLYWHEDNATDNIGEILCSVSWINCYCCMLLQLMCSSKVRFIIIIMVEWCIKCYHTLSGTDMNIIQLKVLLKFYVWYLQSNIINGYC